MSTHSAWGGMIAQSEREAAERKIMAEHEYATTVDGFRVIVDKVGGGTLGNAYTGTWDVSVMNGPVFEVDGETLVTGTPKTHAEVARMAVEFAWAQMDEEV